MISGVVFCPHPPLLIPEVSQGGASPTDVLRVACRAAVRRVATQGRQLVVVGRGAVTTTHAASARGSLAGFGVPFEIALGSDEPGPVELPLPLTVGAWVLRDALGPSCGAIGYSLGPDRDELPPGLAELGADPDTSVALVAMGDGSARRSATGPGHLDERAAPFDAQVASALRSGNPDRLHVDVEHARELLSAGAPVWNATAALLAGRHYAAELLYEDAPYGVGYHVAVWTQPADVRTTGTRRG